MREILPGVFHWVTFHEGIEEYVHSYYVAAVEPAVLIDPRVPDEGLGWFEKRPRPEHAYLTNRHHYRHSGRFAGAFGTKVWCHRAGLHEFTKGEVVAPFEHGDKLPGGILALEVAALCPEETALFIPALGGGLAFGDAVVRYGEELGFVPDALMGDDPEGVKQGLRRALTRLLEREFDYMLFAHGNPWPKGAKRALRHFVEGLVPEGE